MKANISYNPVTVDVHGLMSMCGVGRNRAREIGERSGAVIHLSKRKVLYNVERVKNYMDSITESREV